MEIEFTDGGQFWTSDLVLLRDFLIFRKIFLIENTHKICLQKVDMSLRISNIFRQSQTKLQVIYFHENKLPNSRETG